MRKFVLAAVLVLMAGVAQALLIDRGDGFIYDDVQDLTWAQNANINGPADWASQMAWAAGYSQTHTVYGTFDDWRLPSMPVAHSTTSYDPYDRSDSEMGHLSFVDGITASQFYPFVNLIGGYYWSSAPLSVNYPGGNASMFHFANPLGGVFRTTSTIASPLTPSIFGMAVRDGDIAAVPEPSTALLLGLGLTGLAAKGRRRSRS